MIDELIHEVAAKTRLDASQARILLADALALIRKHADPAKVAALFEATPGAEALAAGAAPLPKSGLLGGAMRMAGGGALADGMAVLQSLSKSGIVQADMQAALPIAVRWVKERAGADLLGEALQSIPGAGGLLSRG
jgi:hypothetical protein